MGQDYSYSQPDSSDQHGRYCDNTEEREIEVLIRMDEAESSLNNAQATQYPLQPEVEFGFPKVCYCGGQPLLSSYHNRRFFTCGNVDDGEMHIHKWWDEAVMEEMQEIGRHCEVLSQKVDNLPTMFNDETSQTIDRLENEVFDLRKTRNRIINGFVLMVLVIAFVVAILGMLV